MGIKKNVSKTTEQKPFNTKEDYISTPQENVHPEFYNYFNLSPTTTKPELGVIHEWANDGSKNLSDALKKIKDLETKLGQPRQDETRMSKLYNYIRLSKEADKVKGMRDSELESIQKDFEKKKEEISKSRRIKTLKGQKEDINEKIKELESKYRKSRRQAKKNATRRSKNIEQKYKKQIKELKERRKAYRSKK